jgi:phosphatidate cytidylyltransferase
LALSPRQADPPVVTSRNSLKRRTITALLLAPPAVLAVVLGPPWSDLLLLLMAAVMAWEWAHVCRSGRPLETPELALILGATLALLLGMFLGVTGVVLGLVAGAVLLLVAWRLSLHRDALLAWLMGGLLYVVLPLWLLHWLRGDNVEGRDLVLWLLLVIWAVDSGAYAFGKTIGGPRLAPRWSPNKTWAGLLGGAFTSMLVGWVAALMFDMEAPGLMGLLGGALAFVGQGGDLLESAIKRRFGLKDASNLIPGHGGVLDRVDGLIAAVMPVAVLVALGVL